MDYVTVPNLSSDSNLPVNDNAQLELRHSPAEDDEISSQSSSTAIIESDAATTPILIDNDEEWKPCGSEQSPSKKRNNFDDDDDGSTCPICFDSWTNLGEHRLCTLKCGHIFGKSCLLRWFSLNKKKSCPTCKAKACNNDIRYVYAKRLIALDVSELEELKAQLEKVTQEKNRIQLELTRTVCKEHLLLQQMESLKQKVDSLNSLIRQQSSSQPVKTSKVHGDVDKVTLYMDKSLEICSKGGCRVMGYCRDLNLIAASVQSPNNLFHGYGVRKIDVSTYRSTVFIPLHNLSIRDISFHSQDPLLLTVSLDKMVKIVDTQVNTTVASYTNSESPLWSCCWDLNDANMFYVGKQQGSISKFDIRNMSSPLSLLEVPDDMSPVISIAPIPVNTTSIPQGGIISCKLNSLWVFQNSDTLNTYKRYPVPLEGPFISMAFENENLLVSSRSNSRCPYTRHHLCKFEPGTSDSLICNTIHCFAGSSSQKLLSRSCFVSNNVNTYVAAHQEGFKSVILWSTKTGQRSCCLPAREPVLDLCGINTNDSTLLAALTAKKIEFFKFSQTN